MKGCPTLEVTPAGREIFLATLTAFPWYSSVKKTILDRYCFGEELLLDLFWLFYSCKVKILPIQQTLLLARLNFLIINRLVEDAEIQRLRLETQGNKVKAFFAALEVLNTLLSVLPNKMFGIALELSESYKLLSGYERQLDFVQKALRNAPACNGLKQNLTNACEGLRSKCRASIAQLMALWYSGEASKVVGHLRQQEFAAQSPTLKQGPLRKTSQLVPSDLRKVSLLRGNPKLQAIANRASVAGSMGLMQIFANGEEEVSGICNGNDIDLVLMEQWASFSDPKKRKRVYLQFVEHQMWMLELTSSKKLGGFIICIDCSGSMRGAKEETAKAIAVYLLALARLAHRDSLVILFGDRDTVKVLECSDGNYDDVDILEIAHTFFNTKTTDFSRPLEEALAWIEKRRVGQSDLLIITDGLGHASKDIIEKTNQHKQDGRLFSWVIIVGKDVKGQEDIRSLSGSIFNSTELFT